MINQAIDDVFKLIGQTLSEITISERDTQATRDNFLDLVRPLVQGGEAQLDVPLILLCADPTEDDTEWSIDCDNKRLPLRIYYVAGFGDGTGAYTDADGNTYTDCAAYVMGRLEVLKEAFKNPPFPFYNFQTIEGADVDVSQSSDPNELFSNNGWPYFAGCLSIKLLINQQY